MQTVGRTTDRADWTMAMWMYQSKVLGWVVAQCSKRTARRLPAAIRRSVEFVAVCGNAADGALRTATSIAEMEQRTDAALQAGLAAVEAHWA